MDSDDDVQNSVPIDFQQCGRYAQIYQPFMVAAIWDIPKGHVDLNRAVCPTITMLSSALAVLPDVALAILNFNEGIKT
jgi:hypothetical protein